MSLFSKTRDSDMQILDRLMEEQRWEAEQRRREKQNEMEERIQMAKMQMAQSPLAQHGTLINSYGQQLAGAQNVAAQQQAGQQAYPGTLGGLGTQVAPSNYRNADTEIRSLCDRLHIPHQEEYKHPNGGFHMLNDILTKICEKLQMIQPEEVDNDLIDAVMKAQNE